MQVVLKHYKLKILTIILLPNGIQLSIVFRFHSSSHQIKVCLLFSETPCICPPIFPYYLWCPPPLNKRAIFNTQMMKYNSVLSHQHQK